LAQIISPKIVCGLITAPDGKKMMFAAAASKKLKQDEAE
jgi:hypothetical protein